VIVVVVPGSVIVVVDVLVTTCVTVLGGNVLVTVRPGVVCKTVRVCVRTSFTVDAGSVITLPSLVIVRAGIFFLTVDTTGALCTLTTAPFSVTVCVNVVTLVSVVSGEEPVAIPTNQPAPASAMEPSATGMIR
jgi:hypothetical protein